MENNNINMSAAELKNGINSVVEKSTNNGIGCAILGGLAGILAGKATQKILRNVGVEGKVNTAASFGVGYATFAVVTANSAELLNGAIAQQLDEMIV